MRKQDERTSVFCFFFLNFKYFQECDVLLAKNTIVMIHKNNIRYRYSKLGEKYLSLKKEIFAIRILTSV